MCRSIKKLRRPDGLPSDEEVEAAALQFVRKVSGFTKPSQANQAVFNAAIAEISASVKTLLDNIVVREIPAGHGGELRSHRHASLQTSP
jgi:hypothetical protein